MNATHCHKGSGAKRSSLAAAAASIIAFAAFAGCEQPSDKDSANQEQSLPAGLEQEEAVPATAENILGTWNSTYASPEGGESAGPYAYAEDNAISVAGDGTYRSFLKLTRTSTTNPASVLRSYSAKKGTYAFDDGIITWTETHTFTSSQEFDPEALTDAQWNASTLVKAEPVAIIGGKLCTGAFRREGAGTGLIGSWSKFFRDTKKGEKPYLKHSIEFTPEQMTIRTFSSTDNVYFDLDSSNAYPYVIAPNGMIAYTAGGTANAEPLLYSVNLLALGRSTIYTKAAR